jgi:MFS transporter, DHA1 family, multidrug resistance protein
VTSQSPSALTLPILVGATALGLLASAIYVPSIPDIARELDVPVGQVTLTITTFLFTFGAATLFVGALSDRFGRRGVLIGGSALCAAASFACALAWTIDLLLIGRAAQAIGACAGIVVARATVRDLYDRDGTARAMALLAMAATLAPILGPALGGYIHVWLGWRANFIIVGVLSVLVMLLTAAWLPETNTNLQNQTSLVRGLFTSFTALLRQRRFLAYALAASGGSIAFYGFIAATPVLLIDRLGVSPDLFGICIGIPPMGFLTGSYVSSRLAARVGLDRLILCGGFGHILCGTTLFALAYFGIAAPWAVIAPLLLMGFSNGLIMSNAYAGGVSVQPQLAGAASGLANFLQMFFSALAVAAFSTLTLETAMPLGVAIGGAGIFIIVGILALARGADPAS